MSEKTKENKKPVYKQWYFWTIIVLALCLVAALSSNSAPQQTQVSSGNYGATTQNQSSATAESASNTTGTIKVGESAVLDGMEVSVNSAERNYTATNRYTTPGDGKEFVKVTITMENKSGKTQSYNSLNWKIEDANGTLETYASLAQDGDDRLNYGDLVAGGKKTGTIVFEVPTGDALKLHYKPNSFRDDEIIVELQ